MIDTTGENPSASRKRFKRCILHIGTEKTGTTAIQNYLIQNRSTLKTEGVLHPNGANKDHTSQWEFAAIAHDSPWTQDMGRAFGITDKITQARFQKQLEASLEREFQQNSGAENLLISSEHFQSRLLTPEHVQALKSFLDRWVENYQILVYFRRQDLLALSYISTRLKSSVDLPQKNILAIMRGSPRYYAYDKIYERWESVFGSASMIARLYEERRWFKKDIVKDFCKTAGLKIPDGESERLNPSLNRQGFQFLRALNHQFPITPGDKSDLVRARLVKAISDTCAGRYYPISRMQALAFYREFEETNERLRLMAFKEYNRPLFSEDFAEYPGKAEDTEPSYAEAVEIAYALWKRISPAQQKPKSLVSKLERWILRG